MTDARHRPWIRLDPPLTSKASQQAFVDHARALARVRPGARGEDLLKEVRAAFVAAIKTSRRGDRQALLAHPRSGASWEGFVLEHMLQRLQPDETYFWATHTGAELDALFIKDGRRLGIEIKRADAPRLTPSMRHALHDLELDALWVIYPGQQRYRLHERVEVLPFATGMAPAGRRS